MADGEPRRRSDCAIAGTLDILGDRWSLLIVRDLLFKGELRYGDLAASDEAIPTNTLADRLRKLEDAEIIRRDRYSQHPPRYTYRLTDRGEALGPALDALATWGTAHLPGTRRVGGTPPAAPPTLWRRQMSTSPPEGFGTVTPRMVTPDVEGLVGFLRHVFGATGEVHRDRPSEIRIGNSLVMVSSAEPRDPMAAFLYVYVDDVDKAYRAAVDAGAMSLEEPRETPYGDRRCMVRDCWNNVWQIATRRRP